MTSKKFSIVLVVLSLMLCVSLACLGVTVSRYLQTVTPDGDNGELEYTVANQITVDSVEAFFRAVENCYPNIKIADEVENPFVVSGGEMEVTSDLILDLNGHDIQRNNQEPMLKINEGVRMVVVDTSATHIGSFYNPVGSVLEIDGGTLTVLEGKFESGVRFTEYSNTTDISTYGTITGEMSTSAESVSFYVKKADNSGYTLSDSVFEVPVIKPYETIVNGRSYVTGNIYYPQSATAVADGVAVYNDRYGNRVDLPLTSDGKVFGFIKQDTYLYYTDDHNSVSLITPTEGSADFYYTYSVTSGEDTKKVTIYGYYNVLQSAEDESTQYSAIKMNKGNLYVRGGSFDSNFGVVTTSCIQANGGNMVVYNGEFTAQLLANCVTCDFPDSASKLTIYDGYYMAYGGDVVFMNSGIMAIYGGIFQKDAIDYSMGMLDADSYHPIVDGVRDMTIATQRAWQSGNVTNSMDSYDAYQNAYNNGDIGKWNDNNSVIHITGGNLTVCGSVDNGTENLVQFRIRGSNVSGINAAGGAKLDVSYARFDFLRYEDNFDTFNPETINEQPELTPNKKITFNNNVGIYNAGGNINVYYTLFRMPGDYATGIVSTATTSGGGSVGGSSVEGLVVETSIFSMKGLYAVGIDADDGNIRLGNEEELGDMYGAPGNDLYAMFYIEHIKNCVGIYCSAKSTTEVKIDAQATQFFMGQTYCDSLVYGEDNIPPVFYTTNNPSDQIFNSVAIYMDAEKGEIKLGRVVMFLAGDYTAGIFVRNGTIDQINNRKVAIFAGAIVENYLFGGINQDINAVNHSYKKDDSSQIGHYRYKFGRNWYVAQYGTGNYNVGYEFDVEGQNNITGYGKANAIGDYGIISLGGNILLNNLYIALYSTYGSGIYSAGGVIDLTYCDEHRDGVALDHPHEGNFQCEVKTADNTSKSSPYNFGDASLNPYGHLCEITSFAVRTDKGVVGTGSSEGGVIYIRKSNVVTDSYGYYVRGGEIFFGANHEIVIDTDAHTAVSSEDIDTIALNTITATRAPAISIYDGDISLYAYAGSKLDITSNISNGDAVYSDFINTTVPPASIYINGGDLNILATDKYSSFGVLNVNYSNVMGHQYLKKDLSAATTKFSEKSIVIAAISILDGSLVNHGSVQVNSNISLNSAQFEVNSTVEDTYINISAVAVLGGKFQSYYDTDISSVIVDNSSNLTATSVVFSGLVANHGNIEFYKPNLALNATLPTIIINGELTSSAVCTSTRCVFSTIAVQQGTLNCESDIVVDSVINTGHANVNAQSLVAVSSIGIVGSRTADDSTIGVNLSGKSTITSNINTSAANFSASNASVPGTETFINISSVAVFGGTFTSNNAFEVTGVITDSASVLSASSVAYSTLVSNNGDIKFNTSSDGSVINIYGKLAVQLNCLANRNAFTTIAVQKGNFTCANDISVKSHIDISGSTLNSKYAAINAVYVRGGSLTATGKMDIYCGLYHSGYDPNENASVHPAAIFVNGGSLSTTQMLTIAGATLNNGNIVTVDNFQSDFTANTSYTNPRDFVATTFAIKVMGESSSATDLATCDIKKATINTICGGGTYVNNGELTLGTADMVQSDIQIYTYGNSVVSESKKTGEISNGNWQWQHIINGGPAVMVEGGKLIAYGGTYYATNGDGICVRGGDVLVHNGWLEGHNVVTESGTAASYGLKVLGGNVTVYDGTIGALTGQYPNSLAVVGNSSTEIAHCNIYGGTFNGGNAAICIFGFSDVVLGTSYTAAEGSEEAKAHNSKINVTAKTAAVTLESIQNKIGNNTVGGYISMVVNSGNYIATQDSTQQVFYTHIGTFDLTIKGGVFMCVGKIFGINGAYSSSEITIEGGALIYGNTFENGASSILTATKPNSATISVSTIQPTFGIEPQGFSSGGTAYRRYYR